MGRPLNRAAKRRRERERERREREEREEEEEERERERRGGKILSQREKKKNGRDVGLGRT